MPLFLYQGTTLTGIPVSGELKAKNPKQLEDILSSQKILVTSITKKVTKVTLPVTTRRIKRVQITRFTRQFATMLNAGLSMTECLEILSQQAVSSEMKRVVNQIKEKVQTGGTLAEALAEHKKVFDELYVHMVEAGEVSGTLDTILNRLATYREKADSLVRKVKAALVYPSIIIVVSVVVTILMLTYIVPIFARMFEGIGSELPLPTQIVLAISSFLQNNILTISGLLVLLLIGMRFYFGTEKGRLKIDKVKLSLPLVGDLTTKTSVSRFSRTLGTLLSSGVAILDALEVTGKTAGNKVIEQSVKKSALAIAEGETITEPLKESGVFPPMVTQMIAVGEKTGNLDELLNKIADFYEEEVDTTVAALTSVIEPVIILIMGVIIGGILVAIYLPMFEIIGKIG